MNIFLTFSYIGDDNLLQACANGFEIRLPGLFCGSLLVCVSSNFCWIDVGIHANTPDLVTVVNLFRKIISGNFPKCIFLRAKNQMNKNL